MHDILNFYQITENTGTAGQPTAGQFHRIAAAGYRTVINLAMHDSDNALPEEGNLVASLGMDYIHLPVPFDRPTAGQLAKFFRLLAALEGEKVFVHCALNARVSAFMYKYLTLEKSLSNSEASSPILNQWLPDMDDNWRAIIDLAAEDIA